MPEHCSISSGTNGLLPAMRCGAWSEQRLWRVDIQMASKFLSISHTSLLSSALAKPVGFSRFLMGSSYYTRPKQSPSGSSCRPAPLVLAKPVPVLSSGVSPARSLGFPSAAPLAPTHQSSPINLCVADEDGLNPHLSERTNEPSPGPFHKATAVYDDTGMRTSSVTKCRGEQCRKQLQL